VLLETASNRSDVVEKEFGGEFPADRHNCLFFELFRHRAHTIFDIFIMAVVETIS
jgi:hypothetical protein